jgi:hypothetical protein
MKTKANFKFKVSFCCLLGASIYSGISQDFVNLDFNSANIPIGTSPSFVPISEAIPGWTAYLGNNQQTSVVYDDLAIGSAAIAILDSNSPVPGPPGNNYTVVLQAGGSSAGDVSASISQSALIPSTANSLLFEASLPYGAGWQVSIAGQNVPVSLISTIDSSYALYAANVSTFAGHVDNLEFMALPGAGPTVNLYLGSISFSHSSVPEPDSFGLFALGGLFVAWRHWRKGSRLI